MPFRVTDQDYAGASDFFMSEAALAKGPVVMATAHLVPTN